ncbi:MAG: DUF998 domain-containing protein [Mycobacterium sp.]
MSTQVQTAPPVRIARVSGLAGIWGPVIFSLAFAVQGWVRRGDYDRISEPVSALEAGPNGWIQQVNFVVFGLLLLVFAAGLNRAITSTRLRRTSGVLLVLSGIGLLLAAALPLEEDAAGATYDPGGHFVSGVTFFGGSALALVVLSVRMRGDANWRGLASYTLGAGCVALVCFVVLGWFAISDAAPLHAYAGLLQRATLLVVTFPCFVAMGIRLFRLSRRS